MAITQQDEQYILEQIAMKLGQGYLDDSKDAVAELVCDVVAEYIIGKSGLCGTSAELYDKIDAEECAKMEAALRAVASANEPNPAKINWQESHQPAAGKILRLS